MRQQSNRASRMSRNTSHVNNFIKTYPYKYIEITPELVPECLQLECKWFKANSNDDDEKKLNDERQSMIYALSHFEELGLTGGAICVNHQIVAFSFGAPITYNTFGVHDHLTMLFLFRFGKTVRVYRKL